MSRLRWFALLALVGFVAAPAARVYTADAPMIDRIVVSTNDVTQLVGHGVPGTYLAVYYKQRNFKEGAPDGADPFSWCAWKFGGNRILLGSTIVNGVGNWVLSGLDVMVLPSVPDGSSCAGGLKTEFEIDSTFGGGSAPTGHWLNLRRPTSNTGTVAGGIQGAHRVAAMVTDGPDDGDTPFLHDVDEDGADLCANGIGCGANVTFKCSGGTFQCPQTTVYDASTVIQNDHEYPFILGMMTGHKPGGSVIMAAELSRPALGPTFNVNLKIKGLDKLNLCDTKKFFDFGL
jgi:hypothetical protein